MLLKQKYIYIILLHTISLMVLAQKHKADKLYQRGLYYRAIPKYEKAIKTTHVLEKQESLIKLADCYRILNDYQKSAASYKAAIALGKVDPDVYYYYGNILKSNNNYSEALNNYMAYLEFKPTDKKAEYAVKSCQEIKYWQSKPQDYQVSSDNAINTSKSEFSPVLFNNKLVFVGEKQQDFVEFSTNGLNGEAYLNIYSTDLKSVGSRSKVKSFSTKVNTTYHDGPVAFSSNNKTMYLTRVNYVVNKKNKDFVNRAKLYIYQADGKSWGSATAFPYNSDDYSCGHATVSEDGNTLYFSSDRPGGFGGKDIWMCKKNGDSWDKPVNLGFDINTSGDEMYPYSSKNGMLYFSSNGLPGFGGLDIYSAKNNNGIWLLNRNEGLLLNSNADDFGVIFTTDSTGYFSSNREGSKGKDDIYSFTYVDKSISIDGTVLLTENINDPAKGVKVYLLDENGKRIDSTKTDNKGYFIFKNLEVDKSYMAEIADDDLIFKNKARYYMADKNQVISRVTHNQGNAHKFVFKNLPIDVNGLSDLYNDDDLTLGGNLLYGENPSKPIANKTVSIKNEFGDVVQTTTTNEFGAFVFRNLPIDQNYTLTIEEDDLPSDMKVILTNKSGKEVKLTKTDGKGRFKFNFLSVDKAALKELDVDDLDMIMSLKGYIYDQNKKILPNVKVTILNDKQNAETIVTDDKGGFQFRNLAVSKSYLFAIEDDDVKFANVSKIYLADSRGRIYKEIKRNTNGKFQYQLLAIDKTALGEFTVDDPWLQVLNLKYKQKQAAITIIENLTYAYGAYKVDATGFNVLDKVITVLNSNPKLNIELSSHTDSRSTDAYNLILSQKRAKSAVDYIVSKGINKARLKAIGYGESKLLNNCKSDVPCSEEEHAKNRRTEFKIIETGNL